MQQRFQYDELDNLKKSVKNNGDDIDKIIRDTISELISLINSIEGKYSESYVRSSVYELECEIRKLDILRSRFSDNIDNKYKAMTQAKSAYLQSEKEVNALIDKNLQKVKNAVSRSFGNIGNEIQAKACDIQNIIDEYDVELTEAELTYFVGLTEENQRKILNMKKTVQDIDSKYVNLAEYDYQIYQVYKSSLNESQLQELYTEQGVMITSYSQVSAPSTGTSVCAYESGDSYWNTGSDKATYVPYGTPVVGDDYGFEVDTLGSEVSRSSKVEMEFEEGDMSLGASTEVAWDGYISEASTGGTMGMASGEMALTMGDASSTAQAKAVLIDENSFAPELGIVLDADVAAIKGEVEGEFGKDNLNVHSDAEGNIGTASAELSAGISREGVNAKVEAGAAVFSGEATAGVTIGPITVDATIEGEAISVGASGEINISTNEAAIGAKLSAVLGVGAKIRIAWE